MTVSILTVCRSESDDAAALVRALEASTYRPTELVIVWSGTVKQPVSSEAFRVVEVELAGCCDEEESLAEARNAAAKAASGGRLIFVDPGYLPSSRTVEFFVRNLLPGRVIVGELRTLDGSYVAMSEDRLLECSRREHDQAVPPPSGGMRQPKHFFRPEAFAISRPHFWRLGGFASAGRFRGADEVDWSLWSAAKARCFRRLPVAAMSAVVEAAVDDAQHAEVA